jgi:hypothetical protein
MYVCMYVCIHESILRIIYKNEGNIYMNQFIINYQIKKSGYLPEGVDETIPQITNKLNADMMQFKQLFDSKYSAEEELEKERKGFSDAAFCICFVAVICVYMNHVSCIS